jgi:pimeloyl-ACP methyl ester carboxylesterase
MNPAFVEVTWRQRAVSIEYQWLQPGRRPAPLLVFLHEGLGSVALWRDFPAQLCEALGCRGLVYSRPGYGQSTARARDERWAPDFMHQQALEVLPALMQALDIDTAADKPWLLGHSDGGSIALLHAAHRPQHTAGAIVLAPHIVVEEVSVRSIGLARQAYQAGGLRDKLARYHRDPDSAFWGWNEIWLDPGFQAWNIEQEIGTIRCPLLAVQGVDDEYGTLEQIRGIARRVPHTQLLELTACGHAPHKDQPQALMLAIQRFFSSHNVEGDTR